MAPNPPHGSVEAALGVVMTNSPSRSESTASVRVVLPERDGPVTARCGAVGVRLAHMSHCLSDRGTGAGGSTTVGPVAAGADVVGGVFAPGSRTGWSQVGSVPK